MFSLWGKSSGSGNARKGKEYVKCYPIAALPQAGGWPAQKKGGG